MIGTLEDAPRLIAEVITDGEVERLGVGRAHRQALNVVVLLGGIGNGTRGNQLLPCIVGTQFVGTAYIGPNILETGWGNGDTCDKATPTNSELMPSVLGRGAGGLRLYRQEIHRGK